LISTERASHKEARAEGMKQKNAVVQTKAIAFDFGRGVLEFTMIRTIKGLARDERGATALEYGFVVALISAALIVGAQSSGESIGQVFTGIGDNLSTALDKLAP